MPGQQKTVTSECLVLGVATSDAWSAVKAAYRRLAHELHPDKHEENDVDSAEKTAQFRKVQEAFEFLEEHKERFGVPESPADTSASLGRHYYDNTTDNVPEPEFIRIENITAYIRYERTWRGALVAHLEVDIDDVTNLKWYPVPTHQISINEVRVMRNGVKVMSYMIYYPQEVNEFRTEFASWRATEQRKNAAIQLQPRMNNIEAMLESMHLRDRPVSRLVHLVIDAREAHGRLNSLYRPVTVSHVEKAFDKVEEELERLKGSSPQAVIDDLLEGALLHQYEAANRVVIDQVRSWHIRTNGFIDLIDEPALRAFYERRVTSGRVKDLRGVDLGLKLENYVMEELLDELDVVAPATIELSVSKGVREYPVTYDYFERDGHTVAVATVAVPLRVYEHNAPEYGKASKFPVLPFGIQWRVEILFENEIVFSGMPGDDLEKKITKFNKYRNGFKPGQKVSGLYGTSLWTPIAHNPLPPWYKGKTPRG